MAQSDSERNNALLREMQRTSLDKIRIYNPTDTDFTIMWDGFKHVVPNKNKDVGFGKGQRVVERYLALWYLKHMTDHIINEKQQKRLDELKEKYEKAGVEDYLVKANMQLESNKSVRTDNEAEVKRIAEIIWLGIEERYGMDDKESDFTTKMQDQRPIHEQIAATLNNKVYKKPEEVVETSTEYPINKSKKKLLEEVQQ